MSLHFYYIFLCMGPNCGQFHITVFKKTPWVTQPVLLCANLFGGLGLPHISKYYYAAKIEQSPLWHAIHDVPLADCLSKLTLTAQWPITVFSGYHPSTAHSLKLWNYIKYSSGLISPHSHLLSIVGNFVIILEFMNPAAFCNLISCSITTVSWLSNSSSMKPFPTL